MDDPFSARIEDGRLYGRGAYDMKCGLAACLGAVRALREAGDVLVVAVADEETASVGMADVLTGFRADAAVVTEPPSCGCARRTKGSCGSRS